MPMLGYLARVVRASASSLAQEHTLREIFRFCRVP